MRFIMRHRRRAAIILMLNLAALFVFVWTALSLVALAVRGVWRLLFRRMAPKRASPARARFRKAIALAARVSRQRRRVPIHSAMRVVRRAIGRRIHPPAIRRFAKWRNISRLHVRITVS